MKSRNISLTLDYELWGDGSGDIFNDVIYPTKEFLTVCNLHNIKCTIFFEILEYLKIKKEFNSGNPMGYSENPALAVEAQIVEAYRDGHDVQLHLHPQWINAYFGKGRWNVDVRYWKLPSIPLVANSDCEMGLNDLINLGKVTIEQLLGSVNPEYECNIFRAGGYNIMPSKNIVSVLINNGFRMDSSVFPGGYSFDDLSEYDYRSIGLNDNCWYCSENSILEKSLSNSGFIEIPIYASIKRRFFKLNYNRVKNFLLSRQSALDNFSRKGVRKGWLSKIKYFLCKDALVFDFCLLSLRQMKSFYSEAIKVKRTGTECGPLVLIGHSKNFLFPETFKKFIEYALSHGANFITLSEVLCMIEEKQRS